MRLTIALLALLAGCATPQELRSDSDRSEFSSRQSAADVAQCIARTAEEQTRLSYPFATVRETGGRYEVQVRSYDNVVLMVADVVPSGAGARATIHRAPYVWATSHLPAAMAKGC
jgi:hypothetical protein